MPMSERVSGDLMPVASGDEVFATLQRELPARDDCRYLPRPRAVPARALPLCSKAQGSVEGRQ